MLILFESAKVGEVRSFWSPNDIYYESFHSTPAPIFAALQRLIIGSGFFENGAMFVQISLFQSC